VFAYSVRHAVRGLIRERGFTTAAVLTLALGVGASSAVFAVVEAVLLRPLPYADAGSIAVLNHRDQRTGVTKAFIAIGDYVDLVQRQSAFAAVGAYGGRSATVYNLGEPFRASALLATSGVFDALGIQPSMGRALQPGDSRPGAAKVAILGHALWERRFGSDPAIVGRGVRLGSDDYQIVGVGPKGFHFPPDAPTELILPQTLPLQAPAERKAGWTFAVARLKPGIDVEAASSNLAALSRQFEAQFPQENQGSQYFALPLRDSLVGSSKSALVLLLAAVGVVLLIACANVANLLLARSLSRRREIAVRLALGAGRRQLAVHVLAESLVLAVVGGLVGVVAARWGVRALVALVPRSVTVPGLADVGINSAVLVFTLGVSVAVALVCGLVSAMTVRGESGSGALVAPTRVTMSLSARRAASALVVFEVALAIVLLVGAGLILRSFARLANVDPGFRADHVMTVGVGVPADRYREEPARQAFYARAFAAVHSVPGVQEVGTAAVTPLTGNNWTVPFERSDQPVPSGQRPPDVGWQAARGGYFTALRIPLLAGRLFDDRDTPTSPPVVIVSDAIAQRFFRGEPAVGRTITLGTRQAEIVGVVGNIRRAALTDDPRADMYFSSEQGSDSSATWFVRTAGDPAAALAAIQTAIRGTEPGAVFVESRTMAEIASESMQVVHLASWLFGFFAVTALALAAVGIYGVLSYVIRQRTREIGMRVALGATRGHIAWMVMRQGAAIAGIGTSIGLIAGLAAGRMLDTLLFATSSTDPLTLTAASATLVVTVLAACYIPARRAARIDPARTLGDA
jgi:putative ABC transport system permease protein